MKKSRVFLKLFAIISIFLILFIGIIILLQTKYFGTYYSVYKENKFRTAVQETVKNLSTGNISNEELRVYFKVLYAEYGCIAMLIHDEVEAKKSMMSMGNFDLSANDARNISDILVKEFVRYKRNLDYIDATTVRSIRYGEQNVKYFVSLQEINVNGESNVLGVVSSVHEVDEAMATLGNISWLAYLISVLVSLIIATIIAKLVTLPLIKEIEQRKALDIMRRDFIANASHEMKTPISIISGYAESLTDDILTPEERVEYVGAIYDESQRMGRLVREMLEIAMLQNEAGQLRKEQFDLLKLTRETLTRFGKQINDKQIDVTVGVETESVTAYADKSMIETVIINLISNAIYHTNESRNITLRLTEFYDKTCFEIENEGEAIDGEAVMHIWESFFRADKSHSREDGRYGLGLFAVKTVIDKHDGSISTYNKDKSVVFEFSIPK